MNGIHSDHVSDSRLTQQGLTFHDAVEQFEKRLILNTLEQHHWHKTHTAETLGIPRSTLRRKMQKYGLL
jgi:DNA-binding NtrC family response regulator